MWKNVVAAPADAILGLTEAYRNDPNPRKVNLGVGVYKDERGETPIPQCVGEAERRLLEVERTKSYLPIGGTREYASHVRGLLFGEESETALSGRSVTLHAPGGTGALRIGATLLKRFLPEAKLWVSSPTWANHKGVFSAAGFEIGDYPYYDASSHGVDFAGMTDVLESVPAGDVVLLHACCHNPTGADLSADRWEALARLAREKGWIPFLDFAYQGFGEGIEADRSAVERMAEAGIEFFVASSFSKNFGLYNERAGALTIVAENPDRARVAESHAKRVVRVAYSNPPAHGGLIVSTVLGDADLRARWVAEVGAMRERIKAMRAALADGLAARPGNPDFSFVKTQRGMFSFSGLSDEAVAWLRENRSVYVVKGGRVNVAGLTPENVDYVCDAISDAIADTAGME